MAKKKQTADKVKPTFEESIARLSDVVRQLEEGSLSLDESLARYEEGIRHLVQCKKILSAAERKIEVLTHFDELGNAVTKRFDDEEMSLQEKAEARSRRRGTRGDTVKSKATQPEHGPDSGSADDVDVGGTLF